MGCTRTYNPPSTTTQSGPSLSVIRNYTCYIITIVFGCTILYWLYYQYYCCTVVESILQVVATLLYLSIDDDL